MNKWMDGGREGREGVEMKVAGDWLMGFDAVKIISTFAVKFCAKFTVLLCAWFEIEFAPYHFAFVSFFS